jgi:peptide/nickel transport system substrate-binding protein
VDADEPDGVAIRPAPGVKFHDGTPFTADDVVFTFKRAAGEGSDMKGYTNPIKEVRKVGDLAVEIETTRRIRSCPTR